MTNCERMRFGVRGRAWALCGVLCLVSSWAMADMAEAWLRQDRLLHLLHERLQVADAVARAKWNAGAAIEDRSREQQVLDNFVERAFAAGLSASDATDFMRAQIEANKLRQQFWFLQWQDAGQSAFDETPDLRQEIRPRLDGLADALIAALRDLAPLDEQGIAALRARSRILWGEGDVARDRMLEGWQIRGMVVPSAVVE